MDERKNIYAHLLLVVLGGVIFSAHSCGRPADPGPRKVILIAGKPTHGEGNHEWDKDAQFLKQSLEGATNIEPLDIEIHYNGWPENPANLDDADAIVFLTDGFEHHPLKEPGRMAKIHERAGYFREAKNLSNRG